MSDVCRDTLQCYNSSRLTVTVSEDEIWQRNAAVGECPVSRGNGKRDTDIVVFFEVKVVFSALIDNVTFSQLFLHIYLL